MTVWLLGMFFAFASVHLTDAWREAPPQTTAFDKPLERALINTLGWAVTIMVAIFAVTLSGLLWPGLAGAGLWFGGRALRRRVDLRRWYRYALPLAGAGLVTVLLLFQTVFGDQNFGLPNIFPER